MVGFQFWAAARGTQFYNKGIKLVTKAKGIMARKMLPKRIKVKRDILHGTRSIFS